ANTLSPALTRTSITRPPTGPAILICPDLGSTTPGATACQPLSSCALNRAARTASWKLGPGVTAIIARATASPSAQNAARSALLFDLSQDCTAASRLG